MKEHAYTSRTGAIIIEVPSTVQVPPEWVGWRFTPCGRYLVDPDGRQFTRERLAGLAWRDSTELRKKGFANRKAAERRPRGNVKVVIVELADWHRERFGSSVA